MVDRDAVRAIVEALPVGQIREDDPLILDYAEERARHDAMAAAMRTPGPDPDASAIGRQFAFEVLSRWWWGEPATSARCSHPRPVPVESVVTGELLARLCPDCDEQLPGGG